MRDFAIDVPPAFASYVDAALARLSYLHPSIRWSYDAAGRQLKISDEQGSHDSLRKEIFFQLYREKIHHDTLAIRNRIYEAIAP